MQIYLELNIPNIINVGKGKICDQFHVPAALTPLLTRWKIKLFQAHFQTPHQ